MKAELRKNWVEALRSGKYTQGRGWLHTVNKDNEDQYCCLGVLCDVLGFEQKVEEGGVYAITSPDGRRDKSLFPLLPGDAIGVNLSKEKCTKLMRMNDGYEEDFESKQHPHTFEEIAQWIEENIPAE